MSVWQAILIGLVHGITEFFPVSSSGHLVLMWKLFDITTGDKIFIDVCLHISTLVVLVLVLHRELLRLLLEIVRILQDLLQNLTVYFYNKGHLEPKRFVKIFDNDYRRLLIMILISSIPTGIMGYFLRSLITEAVRSPLAAALGFFFTAVLLFVTQNVPDETAKTPRNASYGEAAIIGIFQGISVIPGISRAGATLSACFLCGFGRKFSVKYSYLISVPAILGACIYEIRFVHFQSLTWQLVLGIVLAMIVAGTVGFFVMKLVFRFLHKKYLKFFAGYSFAAGCILTAAYFML